MKLTMNDHDCCLRCCADERATAEEREFLSYMASLAAARKPVSQAEWLRMQALTGGALSTVTPIQDRPKVERGVIAQGYDGAWDLTA
ncbi:MAG: hypothetical protein MOGMAGMI_01894 [Candidatus Omnitrophica bacterium]|nr:hypothetical protein [Candidatus Omnitrophota bacterium]